KMSGEYDENLPELQEHFKRHGYVRPTLFSKIDPQKTEDDVHDAAEKVREMMDETGLRHVVTIMEIGERHHVGVLVDEFLEKEKAPPEYVDGVYVSISRVNSLDNFLNRDKEKPPSPPAL